MKKVAGLFLIFIFVLSVLPALAAEKIVQMTVPGCYS